jgi:SMC interacting uncharacterized protein involved in chromosome segregation
MGNGALVIGEAGESGNTRGDWRPVPDPTVLTTQQLLREILGLKEVVFTRLEGMDKALALLHDNLTRGPSEIDQRISHLRELVMSRFDTVEIQFEHVQDQFRERDTRVDQTAKASKEALDAALQTAKEAVGEQNKSNTMSISKSEAATNKQIDQLAQLITSTNTAVTDKVNDLKDRLTLIEGQNRGMRTAVADTRTTSSMSVNVIGLIIGTVLSIISIAALVLMHSH